MAKVSVLLVFILLSSCGLSQYHQNQETFQIKIDAVDIVPIEHLDTKNNSIHFRDVLPYEEDQKEAIELREPETKLLNVTPIFPEGEELQKCIGSILVFVSGGAPTRRVNMIPFAICFDGPEDESISEQMANELRIFSGILARDPDNHFMLLIPDEVRDRPRARRRITVVRNFLIQAGTPQSKIIEIFDTPPE